MRNWIVEVKEIKTGKVEAVIGRNLSERGAESVMRGVLINLNTDEFYVDYHPVDK